MKTNLHILLITLLCFVSSVFSQESEYFKTSEIKGIPSSLKMLLPYDQATKYFDFFEVDEETYNSIFYKNLIKENEPKSSFVSMNLILTKSLAFKTKLFPKYEIVINPKVEKGLYSKQRLIINTRQDAITSNLSTRHFEIIFPKETLQTKENTNTTLSIEVESGIEYNNDGDLNTNTGLNVSELIGYSIKSSSIPNTIIEVLDFDEAQFRFINNSKPYMPIFEDNRIYDFVDTYQQINAKNRMKKADQYKSAILFKGVSGLARFQQSVKFQNAEIYFFENIIAGVLEFPTKKKNKLLQEINNINQVINASDLKLKRNGDFPTFYDAYNSTYYKTEQDFKVIRMYFIIEK